MAAAAGDEAADAAEPVELDAAGVVALLDELPQAAVLRARPARAATTRERFMTGMSSRCYFGYWFDYLWVTVTATECQPVVPSGFGGRRVSGWAEPVASVERTPSRCRPGAGGPARARLKAERGVPGPHPLPPGVRARHGAEPGLLPRAAVDPDLDALDAAVLGPGDTGDGRGTGGHLGERAGDVDPREGPDRRLRAPAPAGPVGRGAVEAGDLEIG